MIIVERFPVPPLHGITGSSGPEDEIGSLAILVAVGIAVISFMVLGGRPKSNRRRGNLTRKERR